MKIKELFRNNFEIKTQATTIYKVYITNSNKIVLLMRQFENKCSFRFFSSIVAIEEVILFNENLLTNISGVV